MHSSVFVERCFWYCGIIWNLLSFTAALAKSHHPSLTGMPSKPWMRGDFSYVQDITACICIKMHSTAACKSNAAHGVSIGEHNAEPQEASDSFYKSSMLPPSGSNEWPFWVQPSLRRRRVDSSLWQWIPASLPACQIAADYACYLTFCRLSAT